MSNKYITIDDKDLVWMNETTRLKLKAKNKIYHKYIQNKRFENDLLLLKIIITELNELNKTTKSLYYQNLSKKLNHPLLQAKTYWSILKHFVTRKEIH